MLTATFSTHTEMNIGKSLAKDSDSTNNYLCGISGYKHFEIIALIYHCLSKTATR